MWADEINDPEYQDHVVNTPPKMSPEDFFSQPITCYRKNILNAITGEDTGFRIGSKDEFRFYVIMEQDPYNPKEARRLYFDSPAAYENATGITVSEKSKRRFHENQKRFV
jgi:hypothetical protein